MDNFSLLFSMHCITWWVAPQREKIHHSKGPEINPNQTKIQRFDLFRTRTGVIVSLSCGISAGIAGIPADLARSISIPADLFLRFFGQMPPVGRRKISEFLLYHAIPADLARSISIPADPFLRISDRVKKIRKEKMKNKCRRRRRKKETR